MCIRDRIKGGGENVGKCFSAPITALGPTVEIEYGGYPDLSCLLYTSDAADERSSVDLGGRRIIKKKKYTASGYAIAIQIKR